MHTLKDLMSAECDINITYRVTMHVKGGIFENYFFWLNMFIMRQNIFLRFFLPFLSSKLALEICPFPLPFCSQNANFLMGMVSVISCQSSMPCPIAVSILECCVLPGCSNYSCVALGALTLTVML